MLRPTGVANLVVRLCDVHPSGESLRVSYVCHLTHRESHEQPPAGDSALSRPAFSLTTQFGISTGHKIRLANLRLTGR